MLLYNILIYYIIYVTIYYKYFSNWNFYIDENKPLKKF